MSVPKDRDRAGEGALVSSGIAGERQNIAAPELLGNQAPRQRVYFAATQSKCNLSPMAKTASVKSYDNWEMAHAARKWKGPQTPLEPREVWNISGDFWGVWGDLLLIAKDRVLFASFFLFSFLKRKSFVKSRAVEIKQWRQSYEQEGLQLLFWQWSWCINS